MKRLVELILILFIFISFNSCSKEDKNQTTKKQDTTEEPENPSDTLMSPEEKFSSSITIDFLDEPEDDDLSTYLETELFKYSQQYRGASVMQLTNTIWFVTLENKNSTKNFLLQKFVDFNSNDYYFNLKETSMSTSDVIASANLFRNTTTIKNKQTESTSGQSQK